MYTVIGTRYDFTHLPTIINIAPLVNHRRSSTWQPLTRNCNLLWMRSASRSASRFAPPPHHAIHSTRQSPDGHVHIVVHSVTNTSTHHIAQQHRRLQHGLNELNYHHQGPSVISGATKIAENHEINDHTPHIEEGGTILIAIDATMARYTTGAQWISALSTQYLNRVAQLNLG